MTWMPRASGGRLLWLGALLVGVGLLGLILLMPSALRSGWGSTGGMSGHMAGPLPAAARPLPDAELRRRLDIFAAQWRPAATVSEVMPFADHTYAVLLDPVTGQGLGCVRKPWRQCKNDVWFGVTS
ncbi:hypothetical protein [Deinococcus aerophilus]|uniref:Uncharacterized protein n=1 Tax=Deinococcus aerophilus TaxID=522488 RepID=A0ABQ2H1Q2_9DEIO|nr:hypothetical protein [Deinococcus aerophilus]GGM22652.1 hypothetical protein GCM10010841_33130 [Deinococcus aerophilus]